LDQGFDSARGLGGAFCQLLNFISHHRKASSGTAGRGSLYRSVECQYIGLLGKSIDQFNDITDFLGGFSQALDAFRGLLDLFTNGVHAIDGFANFLATIVGDFH